MELKNNLPQTLPFGNTLTKEYIELVEAFKALQADYEKIGFRNDIVYARTCHALNDADISMKKMLEIIKAGEGMEDVWANQSAGNR